VRKSGWPRSLDALLRESCFSCYHEWKFHEFAGSISTMTNPTAPISFFSLPFPFVDWAVVGFKEPSTASLELPRIVKALADHGMRTISGEIIGAPCFVLVVSDQSAVHFDNSSCQLFSGIGKACLSA
jgi:hypothetical protein